MAPEIEEIGGLASGDIKLLISESEARMREEIEERLCKQDGKMDTMQEDISILVGNAKLTGLVQQTKASIDSLLTRSDEWHLDDLSFRLDTKQSLGTLETNQSEIKTQLETIRWVVSGSHLVNWSVDKATILLKNSEFWKVALWIIVAFAASHLTPVLYHWFVRVIETAPKMP